MCSYGCSFELKMVTVLIAAAVAAAAVAVADESLINIF